MSRPSSLWCIVARVVIVMQTETSTSLMPKYERCEYGLGAGEATSAGSRNGSAIRG